jgi:hypothetical protein
MSEEQRKDEGTEVEGHVTRAHANEEPRDEAETEDEVEGHVTRAQATRAMGTRQD